MKALYYFQKLFGRLLCTPIIPIGRTVGYSLIRSERSDVAQEEYSKIYAPYSLHNVRIGKYTYISKNSNISNTDIGRCCSIGPNFCCGLGMHPTNGISTSPMFYSTAKQNGITLCSKNRFDEFAPINIGNDVFIGANVTVLDGVTISDGAVIGAGAVVDDDVPPYAVAVGVPARIVKYRFDEKTIDSLLSSQWWRGTEDDLKLVEACFWDVDQFLNSI